MKRRIVWINVALVVLLVAVGVGAYRWLFAPTDTATTGRTVAVQTGTVSETVTATGTVSTSGTLELSFPVNGTVSRVKASAGTSVPAGSLLVALDDADAEQAVTSARSTYVQAVTSQQKSTLTVDQAVQSVAQAKQTAKLNASSYEQSVATARRAVVDAKAAWSDACLDPNGTCPSATAWSQLRAAEADVTSAKTAYDQAVQTASATETTNQLKLSQAQVNAEAAQAKQTSECDSYGSDSTQCASAVAALRTSQQQYELQSNANQTAATQAQQSLANADAKVTQANIALKKLQAQLQESGSDGVTSAQDVLDATLHSQRKQTTADEQSVAKAEEALATARLATTTVDTGTGPLTVDQAVINVAQAGLSAAETALAQTRLAAPVGGTIGAVSVSAGDAVQAGTTVVTLLPTGEYEVTASFSEADATKVAVGQHAAVTFDALTDAAATGTVTQLDLVPTTGSNVTTYGATITLDSAPDDLNEGMTASVVVTTDEAENVLWVPSSAVTTAGGHSTVTVRVNGVDTVTTVTIGLVGDSGTEITSGLASGQEVVISTISSSDSSGFPMGGIPGGLTGGGGPPAGGAPADGGGPS